MLYYRNMGSLCFMFDDPDDQNPDLCLLSTHPCLHTRAHTDRPNGNVVVF